MTLLARLTRDPPIWLSSARPPRKRWAGQIRSFCTSASYSGLTGIPLAGAGAEQLPGLLHKHLQTQLGVSFPGGTDLSTGQWQKLAMSRASMRCSPVRQ